MVMIRKAAVAGTFYPGDPKELEATIKRLISEVKSDYPPPKAVIAPHAGYAYSGPVAASAYAPIEKAREQITRVVLLGPTHFYPLFGIAAPEADFFETPLGSIQIDREAIYKILYLKQLKILDQAHQQEHSLEVQLPFLQVLLDKFTLVPFVVGSSALLDQMVELLEGLWGGDETLIVISSDLSHYLNYKEAKQADQKTADAILALDYNHIGLENACGGVPIRGLLATAEKKGLKAHLIDLRNSGDTFGNKSRVVGYGAFHFRKE
jgi:AmmeMemoRadiSam system protein B